MAFKCLELEIKILISNIYASRCSTKRFNGKRYEMKGLTQDKINLKNRNKIDGSGVLDKIRESDDTQGRIRKCHYRD